MVNGYLADRPPYAPPIKKEKLMYCHILVVTLIVSSHDSQYNVTCRLGFSRKNPHSTPENYVLILAATVILLRSHKAEAKFTGIMAPFLTKKIVVKKNNTCHPGIIDFFKVVYTLDKESLKPSPCVYISQGKVEQKNRILIIEGTPYSILNVI